MTSTYRGITVAEGERYIAKLKDEMYLSLFAKEDFKFPDIVSKLKKYGVSRSPPRVFYNIFDGAFAKYALNAYEQGKTPLMLMDYDRKSKHIYPLDNPIYRLIADSKKLTILIYGPDNITKIGDGPNMIALYTDGKDHDGITYVQPIIDASGNSLFRAPININ